MAEYVMHPEDDSVEVARGLLDRVEDPQAVMWSPRPDVPGGGVFVVRDEETVAEVARVQQQKRDTQAQQIADAQAAAEQRDAKADETGLTPTELGFPASTGADPGAPGTEGVRASDEAAARGDGLLAPEVTENPDGTVSSEEDDPDTGESATDDPSTPEDESKMTPAQRRAAKRKAAAEAAAAEQAQADSAAQEETK